MKCKTFLRRAASALLSCLLGCSCMADHSVSADETALSIRGDLNRDGLVNAADLSLLEQILLGRERNDMDASQM